nr:reverse transcriptase domain-containing protein [Tanacetum cinerariifolium]
MPNTRSGASMTHEEVKELVAHRVAKEMEGREAARNLETLNDNRDEQEEEMEDSSLTWWNFHKRKIGVDAAYAMKWARLMKLMTEVYCLRNEVLKMETELWNLTVKGNDLTAYTQRSAENKRRMESNPKDNRGQQPPFKRQNTIGQNVAKAYMAGNNERKGDCKVIVTPNTQGATVRNQQGNVCFECGRPRHFRKDCPKLRSQNRRNQTRNKTGNKTGGSEVTAKAYAIGGGGTNPNSNVVT